MNRLPLTDLNAAWRQVEGRATADCLVFRCPCCAGKRAHLVIVATRKPAVHPGGSVWKIDGSRDLATLTLRPSIDCSKPVTWLDGTVTPSSCSFHGHVRRGVVEWS